MMEALLEVESRCPLLVGPVRDGTVSFRVLERRKLTPRGSQELLEILGARADVETFFERIRDGSQVFVTEQMNLGEDRTMACLTVPRCPASCDAIGTNAFLVCQETNGGGTYRWRLLVADGENLEAVLDKLRRMRCAIRLIRVRRLRPSEILSSRQEATVRFAWDLGYFRFPRRITLTDLARRLGISKSALAQVLRRGEEKIIGRYFQGYRDRR